VCTEAGVALPEVGQYALGMFFFPQQQIKAEIKELIEQASALPPLTLLRPPGPLLLPFPNNPCPAGGCGSQVTNQNGLRVLGWREVPINNAKLGPIARSAEPAIEQLFLTSALPQSLTTDALERKLYVLQQRLLNGVQPLLEARGCPADFHIASLSCHTVVYKGQLTAEQVEDYYPDLRDPRFETDMAMVHSRFSTNTFPSWSRAQPLSSMSHNGEINTVKGNINWMGAREGLIAAQALGLKPEELQSILPIVQPGLSDSGVFNAVLELLMATGRDVPECMMMMVPEAWQNDPSMEPGRRSFYEYMSCLMEPWDGPALVAFTDGRYLGATLDRNGLRPGRFCETTDGRLILASEFGVVDVPPELIKAKGSLAPGKMLMVDFDEHRIIQDDELKARWVRHTSAGCHALPSSLPSFCPCFVHGTTCAPRPAWALTCRFLHADS
jgi:glutamate synthase (NADPH/NADH)